MNMNMQQMMKQAQELQKKMAAMQEDLKKKEVEGNAGGNMVGVTVDGGGSVLKIRIDPSLLNPTEKEVLEDLIVAAINNAKKNADQLAHDALNKLGIPPGMLNNMQF